MLLMICRAFRIGSLGNITLSSVWFFRPSRSTVSSNVRLIAIKPPMPVNANPKPSWIGVNPSTKIWRRVKTRSVDRAAVWSTPRWLSPRSCRRSPAAGFRCTLPYQDRSLGASAHYYLGIDGEPYAFWRFEAQAKVNGTQVTTCLRKAKNSLESDSLDAYVDRA